MPLLGDVFLNTVYADKPERSVTTTDHPVEGGENITDHIEREALEMEIAGVITGPDASSRKNQLEQYLAKGTLLKYSFKNVLNNVVITELNEVNDKEVKNGFKFTIKLKQIRVAKATIVQKLPKEVKKQVAPKENKGRQQTKGAKPAKVYVVKSGDTLSAIGSKYSMSYTKIYDKNKGVIGSNPNMIYPGQKLIIPA